MKGVTPPDGFDATGLVFNPAQVGRVGTAAIKRRMENREKGVGVPFGIPSVDRVFYPLLPGDLVALIARPGHGKTGVMSWWARERSLTIARGQAPDAKKRVVVCVSYEQYVEELHLFHVAADEGIDVEKMARGDLNQEEYAAVVNSGAKRSLFPLWLVGLSGENRMTQPELTLPYLWASLEAIENGGEYIIDSIFVDYLQAMPLPKAESKIVSVDLLVQGLKTLGRRFGAPVISGVQARREVDTYPTPIPNEGDGQWSSGIEQRADRVVALVRPRKYKQEGETFGGNLIVEGERQLLFYIWKQRLGRPNLPVWLDFDPSHNAIGESLISNINFSPKKQSAYQVNF